MSIHFERQYNDFHRLLRKKHDSTTFFIDFHRFWTIVQRFSSILGEGIRSSIFLKKTPSWKKYKKYAARAARAASAIGVHRIFRSDVFAWRFFDFLRDVRNGMIGFGSKIRHRGGTRKINGSGRGAGSAIGVHRICKSSVFAWRFFRLFWGRLQRNDRFLIENWKIEEEQNSAGQAASAIGVLRFCKSSVSAWRVFRLF